MRILCVFMFAAVFAIPSAPAESPDTPGLVGIVVSETDFRLVTSVESQSPAARAKILLGDRLVAVGDVPVAQIPDLVALRRLVSGPPGTDLELTLQRSGSVFRVRLRRIDRPTLQIRQLPPDIPMSPMSDAQGLTNRCSRRRAVVLPGFHMTKTSQPAATPALARRG